MLTAKVFQSGNSQAVRIPKEMQTTQKEFIIRKYGNCLFLLPPDDPWALLRQCIGQAGEDAVFEREQPRLEELPGFVGQDGVVSSPPSTRTSFLQNIEYFVDFR